MTRFWRIIAASVCITASCASAFSQTAEQPVVLIVDLENIVIYRGDVTDSTKLARDPGVTAPLPARAFQVTYNVADIAAVNGKAAKGLWSTMSGALVPRVIPQGGQMIADLTAGGPFLSHWEFLAPDGTWIGALSLHGATGPAAQSASIIGSNGPWLGMTGEVRFPMILTATPARAASVTEDPANRRLHGGGKAEAIFTLYPRYRPSVEITANAPAVFHSDFSPVTVARPARAGEVLIVRARNLGPTRPDLLPPGTRTFIADPPEIVNSPVDVTMSGKIAEVLNQIGWPGTLDQYRVDFRVPSGLMPGTAAIQLTAAWIPGPEVQIPVQ